MNRYSKTFRSAVLVLLALVLALSSVGCGLAVQTGKNVVNEYHALIQAYQDARFAAANGNTCLSLAFSEMVAQSALANNYLTADVAKAKVYREALANYGTKFAEAGKAYEGVTNPEKLDLGELAKAGATPAQMAVTINAYVTTFTEAPLAVVDAAPVLAAQRIVSEKYNQAFACVKDWNDAVRIYNTERNMIPGDVVGRLAEYLKVKELPQELPYFMMQAPSVPPAIPTFSAPK